MQKYFTFRWILQVWRLLVEAEKRTCNCVTTPIHPGFLCGQCARAEKQLLLEKNKKAKTYLGKTNTTLKYRSKRVNNPFTFLHRNCPPPHHHQSRCTTAVLFSSSSHLNAKERGRQTQFPGFYWLYVSKDADSKTSKMDPITRRAFWWRSWNCV